MPTSAEQIRAYQGPALFSYGFRPFFLFGAIWAGFAVAIWPAMLTGALRLPTALDPVQWHVHELLYGYVPAIVAGFLLTAVPNWTGRLPVTGTPLLALFALWLAGRAAVLISERIGGVMAAAIDLVFLLALGAMVAREILAGKNTRNLKVLAIVFLLFAGNLTFHAEALYAPASRYGTRLGISAVVLLIMLIGGRIIPSFTRNWLVRRGPGRLPRAFDGFDQIAMAIAVVALVLWVVAPSASFTGWLAVMTALVHFWRLARWAGERTGPEPLVAILHVGYAFVPFGFVLLALAIFRPDIILSSGALHAWTAGAFGTMTLAVMTRASLGHTGRPLAATRAIQSIYAGVVFSALARIVAGFSLARDPMLHLSAAAWVFAFVGFAAVFAPMLAGRRNLQHP
jgi:uncharacterized protein involved in response to NO